MWRIFFKRYGFYNKVKKNSRRYKGILIKNNIKIKVPDSGHIIRTGGIERKAGKVAEKNRQRSKVEQAPGGSWIERGNKKAVFRERSR